MILREQIQEGEYPPYAYIYLEKVANGTELLPAIDASLKTTGAFYDSIHENKMDYRYADGKWSIKEVIQHNIDTERIFAYRLLRIGRGDQTALAGFDQDIYIDPSNATNKTKEQLLEEFEITRKYSISLIKSLSTENMKNIGTASDMPVSARALGFLIIGHERHHIEVLKSKYLS